MSYTLYYEDVNVGDKRRSGTYHLTEQEIVSFAREWDPQPIHIDPKFAAQTKIGSVFACAVHLLGITTRLCNESWGSVAISAGLGWDKVRFLFPGLPGSSFYVENEVISKRESKSNPDSGIVASQVRLFNQHDTLVLTFEGSVLMDKRPEEKGHGHEH